MPQPRLHFSSDSVRSHPLNRVLTPRYTSATTLSMHVPGLLVGGLLLFVAPLHYAAIMLAVSALSIYALSRKHKKFARSFPNGALPASMTEATLFRTLIAAGVATYRSLMLLTLLHALLCVVSLCLAVSGALPYGYLVALTLGTQTIPLFNEARHSRRLARSTRPRLHHS